MTTTFAPDEAHKNRLVLQFLKSPPIFAELLEKYKERLPSDGNIKFDLIQKGFLPNTAAVCVSVFKKSVEFARFYESGFNKQPDLLEPAPSEAAQETAQAYAEETQSARVETQRVSATADVKSPSTDENALGMPIQLAGRRRAWLEIPTPFYAADKVRLKKFIDVLLTEDEEDEFEDGK